MGVGSVLFIHEGKHENIPLIAYVQASRESRWRCSNRRNRIREFGYGDGGRFDVMSN
ncbi:hypothetical protein HanXRQr2_Chr12g0532921 [Helianthus annuus]|uniref:Uncharacterized protein n=1 Tax=Helianthus annuus TaxID=4232 RepID=A0A251T1Y8_HELAN|nr:hypothetical protein HanXRQr2_Chr12g0532921 [Helianthus annuus]